MNKLGDFSTWDRDIYADLIEKICINLVAKIEQWRSIR